MKNFSKILVSVICLAAFFTSCVKEEIRIREEIQFDVNLTRAGESSSQQGDEIKDIMIWAFDLNDQMNCVGWRQYTPPTTTYTSLSLHVPAKTCGSKGGQYRLVALLNRNTFTDADGNVIPLGRNTTYNDLISGKFVSAAVMNSEIEEDKPGTPAIMPISHWMDVEVETTNTHENPDATNTSWKHRSVNMPVYRTVAKSQFLMAKKGTNASFDLKVVSLKLINNAMPTDGMILSSVIGDGLSDGTATPKWDWNPVGVADENKDDDLIFAPTASTTQGVYTLVNADTEETANNAKSVNAKLAGHDQTDEGSKFYTLIGSHFIYETTGSCEYKDNVTTAPTGDGYYYEVIYEVDGNEYTRCVGINSQIARNHDYQVRALVEAGGKLSLSLVVNEWDDVTQGWDYIDVATLADGGKLSWNATTTVGDLQTKSKLDDEGNEVKDDKGNPVVDYYYRNVTTTEAKTNNQIDIAKCATCTFNIQTPTGGTWYAMFANGDINSFEFVDENGTSLGNTASGNVGSQATLRIRATKSASEINRAQQALLDVVVKTADGRTIKVNGLMVDSKDSSKTIKYQMVQNKN